ncbi:unnamed protein product [Clonostachys solani]|uniref:Uncharacterized protein n=1 Tax=Clonostachys solani TaxID=160281 RepID=A0A9N9ZIY1_9HYPO|nr:unnamed protein product [Clonostachys solani]
MGQTTEEKFDVLKNQTGPVDGKKVAEVFDEAKPVAPGQLTGSWVGGSFDTGHPAHKKLGEVRWAGKDFRSAEDVDPMVVYGENGERVWAENYGRARLREIKFRGVVSTAMVYDNLPIIDSFRYVKDGVVIGAMDSKLLPKKAGTYYFYLSKL